MRHPDGTGCPPRSWVAFLRPVGTLALSLAIVAVAVQVEAGTWKGKEITKEGAKYIVNPAEGMEKATTSELKELWRIGGDTDSDEEFFGVISRVLLDGAGNVYVLDTQLSQVNIYTEDGEYLNTIGAEGEGPGEFKQPNGMFLTDDGKVAVIQTHPAKMVLLTPEGDPSGEHPIPKGKDGGFVILINGGSENGNTVLMARQDEYTEGFKSNYFLVSIDPQGNELTRYCTAPRAIDLTNRSMTDSDWDTIDRRWAVGKTGKVYACLSYSDYRVHVWNPDGSVDRIIEREYEHLKRTPEEKAEVQSIMDSFVKQFGLSVNINDWNKDIENMYVRDDGSMWIINSAGQRNKPDGTIGVFDVFDAKGRFLREVALKGEGDPKTDGYFFLRDKLFVVTDLLQAAISMQSGGASADIGDEEPEPMAVICYELDGDVLTSNR